MLIYVDVEAKFWRPEWSKYLGCRKQNIRMKHYDFDDEKEANNSAVGNMLYEMMKHVDFQSTWKLNN